MTQSFLETVTTQLISLNEKSAVEVLLDAFGRHAVTVEELDLVARLAHQSKRYTLAMKYAEKLNTIVSSDESKSNLANVYAHANYPEKALVILDELLANAPFDTDLKLKKVYALYLLGRRDEASSILRDVVTSPFISPKVRNEINFNLGTYDLYDGNFQLGMQRFLYCGRAMNLWKKPQLDYRPWNGIIEEGKTLIIRAEAGIGDEIINVRFADRIAKLNMNVIWLTDRKDIANLFNEQFWENTKFRATTELSDSVPFDAYWCHSMDIPVLMNLSPDDLWTGPYIRNRYNETRPTRPTEKPWIKVGLRWQGNPDYDNDLHRSVPFMTMVAFAEQFATEEEFVFLTSLQRDTGVEEANEIDDIFFPKLDTWQDTIKAIDTQDIIITSCTSVAHVAAAMGKKTYIFVSLSSYYTWCHPSERSPWYGDNVTLVRQTEPREWPVRLPAQKSSS